MTFSEYPEVLIVDDNIDAAQTFAQSVCDECRLNAVAESDPEKVLDIIKSTSIYVVVLDQVMPQKTGLELYKEIRNIDSNVNAIMLTGEATREDVADAYKIGYFDILDKSRITQLPKLVLQAYMQYEINKDKKISNQLSKSILLYKNRTWKNLLNPIEYYLHQATILNKEYVADENWRNVAEINGDELEVTESYEYQNELILSQTNNEKIFSELQLDSKIISVLKPIINVQLEKTNSESFIIKNRNEKKTVKKYSLSKLTSSDGRKIEKRDIENAPVYIEYRLLICKKCPSCGLSRLYPLFVYKQTASYATRFIDHYDDGSYRIINTGIVRL